MLTKTRKGVESNLDISSKAVVEFVAKTDQFEKGVSNVKKA